MLGESGRVRLGVEFTIWRSLRLQSLTPTLDQHLFDVGDRFSGIQPLGTSPRAIENGMASIQSERIFEVVEPLAGCLVATVNKPPGLPGGARQGRGNARRPPVARTTWGAAETKYGLEIA